MDGENVADGEGGAVWDLAAVQEAVLFDADVDEGVKTPLIPAFSPKGRRGNFPPLFRGRVRVGVRG